MNEAEKTSGKLKKFRKRIDKVLIGFVVGGAVGSILGMTFSPKSGKETQKILTDKNRETWERISDILEEQKKQKKQGIWHMLHNFFVKKRNGGGTED
ncbi:YtxH domain-containing protein [Candidatus Peregrinibacteria bacterium]|nr:MAG: YtxH domain-containing protein [Candidatus Peregrinibacteria bacterium]